MVGTTPHGNIGVQEFVNMWPGGQKMARPEGVWVTAVNWVRDTGPEKRRGLHNRCIPSAHQL